MFAAKDVTKIITRYIAIAEIDRAVAARLGPTRVRGNAQPAVFNRQVAMYLARVVGGWSLTKIGKFYCGRHHTTVRYAIRRVTALRTTNAEVDAFLTALSEEVKSKPAVDPKPPVNVVVQIPSTRWRTVEEFMEELVERLIARLKPGIDKAVGPIIPLR